MRISIGYDLVVSLVGSVPKSKITKLLHGMTNHSLGQALAATVRESCRLLAVLFLLALLMLPGAAPAPGRPPPLLVAQEPFQV